MTTWQLDTIENPLGCYKFKVKLRVFAYGCVVPIACSKLGMSDGGRSADGTGEGAFGFRQCQISGLKLKAVGGK